MRKYYFGFNHILHSIYIFYSLKEAYVYVVRISRRHKPTTQERNY